MRKVFLAVAFTLLGLADVLSASAAEYPSRPITFIVPFAAGGPTDTLGRTLAEPMSRILGQSIVIENIAGAGGTIGVKHVVDAPADGYTISLGNWSTHVLNGAIYSLPFDLVADLKPVALLPGGPQLIVTRKDIAAKNLAELVIWLKDRDHVAVGTAGVGSAAHVSALLFEKQTGAHFTLVHYRGAGPAMTDLVGGHIDMMFDQSSTSLPQVREGTIRSFAVTSRTRLGSAPDIPTTDEAGLSNFYVAVWHGLWAPKNTPADVVAKLSAAAREALSDPALRERLGLLGQTVPPAEQISSEGLEAVQRSEIDKWWPVLKADHVRAQ